MFASRADEFAVLREFADALVRNLFPRTLWGQEVHRCALNEVVAVKGKEAFHALRCVSAAAARDVFFCASVNCDVLQQSLARGFSYFSGGRSIR